MSPSANVKTQAEKEATMKRHTVAEVMTRRVATVTEEAGFKQIVEALSSNGVSAAPVIDADRRVVGIVSEADLLHKVDIAGMEPHGWVFERKRIRIAREKANADFARDLMTTPAITISENDPVGVAARLMDTERIKRLPVVDSEGRLVGIVSRSDLLRPYLRSDDDIRAEVTQGVLLHTMWLDPNDFSVAVDQGVVTIHGEVERRSTVPILVGIVRGVPGVVDVIERVTSRIDDETVAATPPSLIA
jgi:CBS domain-containing protein